LAHERTKEILLRADTPSERANAVREAIALGMPLAAIEEFLDYLDATKKTGEALVSLPSRAAVYTALAASLLLAATLGSIWLYRIVKARSASKPIYVAEFLGGADAQWSEEGTPEADGRLPAGRRLVLSTGLAKIAFASGTHVILEGPAEFKPLSPNEGRLSEGLLSAHVPPAARGFTVRTPDATVVDLGTEFGVAVQQGELSDVEVFSGLVEVQLDDDEEPTGETHAVRAGEAIQVWSPKESEPPRVEKAAAGLMRFARSLPPAEPAGEVAPVETPETAVERFGIPEAEAELVGPVHQPQGRLVWLDLAPYANEALSVSKGTSKNNDLMDLGSGEQTLAGVRFRIGDGTIQLRGSREAELPAQVEAIAVRRRVAKLYLLHAAQWINKQTRIPDGTEIGHYQVHYHDGSQEAIPIISGEDVRDWWSLDSPSLVTRGQVVWVGRNEATTKAGYYLRLYMTNWENPHPDKTVASLDYVSAMMTAGPFCAAITVELPLPVQADPIPLSASEHGSE